MKVIYKYPLEHIGENQIELPAGYQIMSIVNQRNELMLYAIVDPKQSTFIEVEFLVVGTGTIMDDSILYKYPNYISTVTTYDGNFVWHIFSTMP